MAGYQEARKHIGLQEVKDEQTLKSLFKKAGFSFNPNGADADGQPWCAVFVGTMEYLATGKHGTGLANARSYLNYGKIVYDKASGEGDMSDAEAGDIVIFKRGSNGYSGHVAYFVRWDDNSDGVITLGGNQGNSVCEARYAQVDILGIRRS